MGLGKSTFTFSNSSIVLDGGSTTIGITRENQSYSHRLLHGRGQFASLPVGDTSHVWTPTANDLSQFWAEVPSQKTRQINVYLDTYNGSTKVGRDIHALTVTLSEATGKPTLTGFSVTDSNSTTNGWGIIVPGKSNLTVAKTAAAKYGASISKTAYTYGSNEFNSIDDLIASVATSTPTDIPITCKVTDSRGFASTSAVTKKVATYAAPAVDIFEIVRCDANGDEYESGTSAKVIVKGSWSYLGGKNAVTFKIGYKTHSASSYTYQTVSVTNGVVDISQVLNATFDADTDYDFSISLVDSIGNSYIQEGMPFSNSQSILYVSSDGTEIVFGGRAGNHVTIDEGGIDICHGTETITHMGYGEGNSEDGTGTAPYYTLGRRKSGKTVGNWSFASGIDTEASGYGSFAEGIGTKATGMYSHAEGGDTRASGLESHAEGSNTFATGQWSHAQNLGTIAAGNGSTAIGKFNISNSSKAFIIGNGTGGSSSERSNALTVDWNGNLDIAGTLTMPATTSSTASSFISHNTTNCTAVTGTIAIWGKLCSINLTFTTKVAIAAGDITNATLGTLLSGYRPKILSPLASGSNGPVCSYYIETTGDLKIAATQSSIAAGRNISCGGTFILA